MNQVKIGKTTYQVSSVSVMENGKFAIELQKGSTVKNLFGAEKDWTLWSGYSNRGLGLPKLVCPEFI